MGLGIVLWRYKLIPFYFPVNNAEINQIALQLLNFGLSSSVEIYGAKKILMINKKPAPKTYVKPGF